MNLDFNALKFDERGLIPTIVQDVSTKQVLMLAYMNEESLQRTIERGETWFWSRSRDCLWHKGETSGNIQRVIDVSVDCDGDALIVLVEPHGPACHTGAVSCFSVTQSEEGLNNVLDQLYTLIASRKLDRPEGSYTAYLFHEGLDKILKKVGEESAETIIAAKNSDSKALISESADLLYHLLVLFVERGVTLAEIRNELRDRRGVSTKR